MNLNVVEIFHNHVFVVVVFFMFRLCTVLFTKRCSSISCSLGKLSHQTFTGWYFVVVTLSNNCYCTIVVLN